MGCRRILAIILWVLAAFILALGIHLFVLTIPTGTSLDGLLGVLRILAYLGTIAAVILTTIAFVLFFTAKKR
ncbi:MAG: hypothetical protein FWH03_00565 [Firmicutes bacterium]|nr:hypothetical protein [Bacillota bacterium]